MSIKTKKGWEALVVNGGLSYFGDITIEDLKIIAQIEGLKMLYLGVNNIGDEGVKAIAQIKGLEVLGVAHNDIGVAHNDIGVAHNDIGDEEAKAIKIDKSTHKKWKFNKEVEKIKNIIAGKFCSELPLAVTTEMPVLNNPSDKFNKRRKLKTQQEGTKSIYAAAIKQIIDELDKSIIKFNLCFFGMCAEEEEEYQYLLNVVDSHGIEWDDKYMDIVGLRQVVTDYVDSERKAQRDLRGYYE